MIENFEEIMNYGENDPWLKKNKNKIKESDKEHFKRILSKMSCLTEQEFNLKNCEVGFSLTPGSRILAEWLSCWISKKK